MTGSGPDPESLSLSSGRALRGPSPRNDFAKWPAFTFQPWLVCNNRPSPGNFRIMRAAAATLVTLLLAGCAAEAPVGTPAMYVNMAEPGARLDPIAAASMISQYRQNNGLGGVVVDPDLMKLAERSPRRWRAQNKLDHDVKAPLRKTPECVGLSGHAGGRECVGGLPYPGGSLFGLARLTPAQGQYAQKWCHKIRHRGELCSKHQIQGLLDAYSGINGNALA